MPEINGSPEQVQMLARWELAQGRSESVVPVCQCSGSLADCDQELTRQRGGAGDMDKASPGWGPFQGLAGV